MYSKKNTFREEIIDELQENAIVTGLLPATTYLIRMQAINEIERSEFTDPIILKTQETAPTEAPSNVQVESGGDGELIVTWQKRKSVL
uniref:Fibronectin type-III domain-containing protein n=1 Tax=Megaselia scalaris TaxID=36166 RepID=T1GNA1_MEGSC